MGIFKQISGNHLTTTDKQLIRSSIDNDLQDVQTKNKKLHIISTDDSGNVKAKLYSFEVGIGIGSKKQWCGREIVFKPQ